MPERPPVFRPPGWRPRKAWERPTGYNDKRKRGRAGKRDRAAVLAEEPFCRLCLAYGRHRQSQIVDHIIPLAWSRCDERWNKQALCKPCHDEKSKRERAEGPPPHLQRRLNRLKADWLALDR